MSPKEIYDRYRQCAKKELGQNFIFDQNINRKIVDAAGDLDNKIVVEIGPGPGGLTLEILKRNIKKLYIVEYDFHWCDVWANLQKDFKPLELIHGDALRVDITSLKPEIIISNLPYNISTKLLYKWFEHFSSFEKLVLMFQKEVADRIIAHPRTKDYGKMSVIAQWLADVVKICDLSPSVFSPPPKVYSSVLKFVPCKNVQYFEKYHDFCNLLTEAFSARRKVVRKNIKNPLIFQRLLEFGYTNNTRAEEISVEDYVKIFESTFL